MKPHKYPPGSGTKSWLPLRMVTEAVTCLTGTWVSWVNLTSRGAFYS